MVVGLIFEEILNVNVKCVTGSGAQYIGQGHHQDICGVSISRRGTMQGLVVRGLTLEEIWNVDISYVKVTTAKI